MPHGQSLEDSIRALALGLSRQSSLLVGMGWHTSEE
jgi:hypothetical protein